MQWRQRHGVLLQLLFGSVAQEAHVEMLIQQSWSVSFIMVKSAISKYHLFKVT